MNMKYNIIQVTPENIKDHPGSICFINPNNEFYSKKVEWYKEHYKEGLRIKLLYIEGEKKPVGFIEYTPGEYCWRAVSAKGYMFIHCIWTNGKKNQHNGLGSILIKDLEKDAERMAGVAVVTSDNSFMVNNSIFLKEGYKAIAESGKDQLMVKQFRDEPLPSFNIRSDVAGKIDDLTIIYSRQCPWVARFIEEMKPILKNENLNPSVVEINTAAEAQNTPSVYGVFNLINKGKILADRYISTTRFVNIIRKDIKK